MFGVRGWRLVISYFILENKYGGLDEERVIVFLDVVSCLKGFVGIKF